MDRVIEFHIINMSVSTSIIFVLIFVVYNILFIKKLLTDKLLNDTNHKLLELMYKRMRGVGILTNAERTLHSYMKKKIIIISSGYKEAKKNTNIINHPTFESGLLQEGLTYLKTAYNFPPAFIEQVEKINRTCFSQFKTDYTFDAATTSKKKERIHKLIYHLMGSVETNITQIIAAFDRTKRLIQDPDFLEVYPNYHSNVILKENVSTEYLDFTSHVSIKTDKMKNLIASGDTGLKKALDLLTGLTHGDSEINNELITLSARFNDIEIAVRQGLIMDETEDVKKNKIRDCLLSIIDTLNIEK